MPAACHWSASVLLPRLPVTEPAAGRAVGDVDVLGRADLVHARTTASASTAVAGTSACTSEPGTSPVTLPPWATTAALTAASVPRDRAAARPLTVAAGVSSPTTSEADGRRPVPDLGRSPLVGVGSPAASPPPLDVARRWGGRAAGGLAGVRLVGTPDQRRRAARSCRARPGSPRAPPSPEAVAGIARTCRRIARGTGRRSSAPRRGHGPKSTRDARLSPLCRRPPGRPRRRPAPGRESPARTPPPAPARTSA